MDYQAWTNHVWTKYEYDGRGMISSVLHRNDAAGHDLAKRDYWRDDRDRITAWKRGFDNTLNQMENGRGNRYGYDEEGQLTSASYRAENPEGTPTGAVRTDSFQYDPLGNRMGMNHVASRGAWMNFTRRDNGLNQYHSWENDHPAPDPLHWGSGIFHDDDLFFPSPPWVPPGNGVTMADGWIVASFNALNQPMAVGNIGYGSNYMFFGYDPLGRCVKRWKGPPAAGTYGYNPATYFYYDGWSLVQEGSSTAAAERLYVHGGRVDEMVASQVNGVWYHHHYDAQGNCIMQTTGGGGLQVQYDYDAFGFPYFYNAAGGKGAAQTRFLFTGREWLADHRLYDFRARMYQPELGRFLQPDPKQFEAGDYNLYRYCHNDPVNKSDPLGLDPIVVSPAENALALQGDVQNVAAMNANTWLFGLLSFEYASTVYGDSQGNLTLSAPRTDYHTRDVRPPSDPSKISRVETHVHTFTARDDTTNSYLSVPDVTRGNQTGRTQQVISPNGVRDRYRPSDNAGERKRGEGGIIERLGKNGEWHRLSGANTDLKHPGSSRNGY